MDCYRNLNEGDLSIPEARYRLRLIELCESIVGEAEEIEEEIDEED